MRGEERGADLVRSRGGREAHAHRAPVAEERFRAGLARAAGSLDAIAAIGRRRAAAAVPVHESQSITVEQDFEPLAGDRPEAGRRHVVAEDRRDRDRVFAVRREQMVDEQAAARAERQPFDVIVLRRVLARPVDHQRRVFRAAEREAADLLRRGHVRLDQRRRDAERAGDVVEAGGRIVRRQVLRRIDRQVEQVLDDVGVLGAVQAMEPGRGRVRGRVSIELLLQPRGHRLVGHRVRPRHAGRRHHPGAQLPGDELPRLRVVRQVGDVEAVDGQLSRRVEARGPRRRAMTGEAEFIQKLTFVGGRERRRRHRRRGSHGPCGSLRRAARRGGLATASCGGPLWRTASAPKAVTTSAVPAATSASK